MDIRISVIIPIYNAEAYLAACLDSVLAQNRADIEILLIDDGSTDGSAEICRRYAGGHPAFRYFRRQNAGVAVARNFGVGEARGDLIMFVDADDLLAPGAIEALLACMDSETDIACCTCTAFSEKTGLNAQQHFFAGDFSASTPQEKEKLFLQLMNMHAGQPGEKKYTAIGVPWGKLYRASLLWDNGLSFPPGLTKLEDNIFNMYAFTLARKVVYIDHPLYRYRVDHILGETMPPELGCAILEEREKYFERFGSSCSPAVLRGWYLERLRFLREGLRLYARTLPFARARGEIAQLCGAPVYQRLLREQSPVLPRKLRWVVKLARLRCYFTLTIIMRALKFRAGKG